jgi:hypothetical protein
VSITIGKFLMKWVFIGIEEHRQGRTQNIGALAIFEVENLKAKFV